jgi:hypothetical protein
VALIAYLLVPVPYALLAGPLAGFLLLGRPATARERIWSAAALLAAAASFSLGPTSLAQDVIRAGTGLFIGATLTFAAVGRFGTLGRAMASGLVAAGLLLLGGSGVGLEWPLVFQALRTQLLDAVNTVNALAPLPEAQLRDLRAGAEWMARLYPAIAVLGAVAGGALASTVAARVATRPPVAAPGSFTGFRFNDHLIWGAVITLGAALLPLSRPALLVVSNLLVVWVGLYAARGIAVVAALAGRWPTGFRIGLFLTAVLLLPYALGGALVMGLADTWLDFRRTLSPPASPGDTP